MINYNWVWAYPAPVDTNLYPASFSFYSSSFLRHGAPFPFICKSPLRPQRPFSVKVKYLTNRNSQHPALFRTIPKYRWEKYLMSVVSLKKHLAGLWCGTPTLFLLPSAVVETKAGLNRWISWHREPSCETTDGETCSISALFSFLPLASR